ASRRVELKLAVGQDGCAPASLAAHDRPHARQQLLDLERLYQIIVSAEIEPANAIVERIARGQYDNRKSDIAGANTLQDFETIDSGKPEIEQDQIIGFRADCIDRKAAVAHPVDRISRIPERLDYRGADHLVVFGQKHSHGDLT